jgi:hypothetical protein
MQVVSLGIGVLLMLGSVLIFARPGGFVRFAQEVLQGRLRYLAALLRLLFGVVLLATAVASRYPLVFEVLGWLFALGGLLLVVWPPALLERIAGLIERIPVWVVRLVAPLVFVFGGFIFYGFT